jgi:hypothetical protein
MKIDTHTARTRNALSDINYLVGLLSAAKLPTQEMHRVKYEMQVLFIKVEQRKTSYTTAEQEIMKAYDKVRKSGEGWQIGLI